jgi:hypothetical protein
LSASISAWLIVAVNETARVRKPGQAKGALCLCL